MLGKRNCKIWIFENSLCWLWVDIALWLQRWKPINFSVTFSHSSERTHWQRDFRRLKPARWCLLLAKYFQIPQLYCIRYIDVQQCCIGSAAPSSGSDFSSDFSDFSDLSDQTRNFVPSRATKGCSRGGLGGPWRDSNGWTDLALVAFKGTSRVDLSRSCFAAGRHLI